MQKRVRAIIVEDGKILAMKRVKKDETYWVMPGGGIEDNESHEQALIRECKEEIGVDVEIKDLSAGWRIEDTYIHEKFGEQHEFFYECKITRGEVGTGTGPEYEENSKYEGTHELEWIEISKLNNIDVRPLKIVKLFLNKIS